MAFANAPAANIKRTIFCETCDNVLYPAHRNGELFWNCRLCEVDVQLPDTNVYVVHQADIKKDVEADTKTLESLRDYVNDRTVMRARDKPCPKCNHSHVAWFINPLTKTDDDMTIYYACVECRHVWKDPKVVIQDEDK